MSCSSFPLLALPPKNLPVKGPLEALQGLDHDGRVLYIGTFSKVLFPALRLGYLVAPTELIEPLLVMRRFLDMHLPMQEQMALFDFLHEGHYAQYISNKTKRGKKHTESPLSGILGIENLLVRKGTSC